MTVASAGAGSPAPALRLRPPRVSALGVWALVVGLLALTPLLVILWLAVSQPESAAIPPGLVWRYARDTAVLAVLVAVLAAAFGAPAAWLVVMHDFPGRRLFEWALVLPLAVPAFASAYAYADLFDVAGPLRTALREAGIGGFPFEMRSLPGAAFVLACAYYPYVYLVARAAFTSQSVCALEAARTLGAGPFETWRRVALPLARPAVVAGAALVVMETLADYGAVGFLGVQTLTTGVVRAWSSYGAPGSAARLSLFLLGAAALLLMVERLARGARGYGGGSARWRAVEAAPLAGRRAWLAGAYCGGLLSVSLLVPVGWLAYRALAVTPDLDRFVRAGGHSFALAAAGGAITALLALVLAFGGRRSRLAPRLASLGYATPGAVIAVGLLAPAALLWRAVPGTAAAFWVGVALLLYAYAARLMAAALEPLDAGLQRVTPSMEHAARTLGEAESGALRRVHAPMARGAVLIAFLLVFVDILKELPATMIMRPFNLDTLAVIANAYANDERLHQAAWPCLMLIVLAAGPTAFISSALARSRPGGRA